MNGSTLTAQAHVKPQTLRRCSFNDIRSLAALSWPGERCTSSEIHWRLPVAINGLFSLILFGIVRRPAFLPGPTVLPARNIPRPRSPRDPRW